MRHLASILRFCCQPVAGFRYQKLSDSEDGRESLKFRNDRDWYGAGRILFRIAVFFFFVAMAALVMVGLRHISAKPTPSLISDDIGDDQAVASQTEFDPILFMALGFVAALFGLLICTFLLRDPPEEWNPVQLESVSLIIDKLGMEDGSDD